MKQWRNISNCVSMATV